MSVGIASAPIPFDTWATRELGRYGTESRRFCRTSGHCLCWVTVGLFTATEDGSAGIQALVTPSGKTSTQIKRRCCELPSLLLVYLEGGKKSPKHGGYIGHKCRIPEFMWAHKIAHRSIHFGRCSSSSPQWPPSAFRILLNGLHSHRCPLTLTPSAILSLFLPPRFKNIQVSTPDLTQLCPLCQQTWKWLSSTCCPPQLPMK